jgi:hypothetical protein
MRYSAESIPGRAMIGASIVDLFHAFFDWLNKLLGGALDGFIRRVFY